MWYINWYKREDSYICIFLAEWQHLRERTYRSAWAIKLLTTRPSSIFIRGPYVLNILAIRISVPIRQYQWIRESYIVDNLNNVKGTIHYQSHVVGGSQTSMSLPHASPHHNSSEPLTTKVILLHTCSTRCSNIKLTNSLDQNCCLDF